MDAFRIPSLNWLRVFEAAARTENFTQAAVALHMSPSAVSQQIRALESHLGEQLFWRSAQKIVLSEAGRAFLPTVQQSLASMDMAAGALFGSKGRQTVSLQVVSLLAMGWLAERLAGFEQENPGIRVLITTGNMPADFRARPQGHEPDLQIAFGSATDFSDGAVPLFGETLSVVSSSSITKQIHEPGDIRQYRLLEVATHQSGWHQMLAAIPGATIEGMEVTFVDNTPLALMLAYQGFGLALARAPASDAVVTAFKLQTVQIMPRIRGLQRYYIIKPQSRPLSSGAVKFLTWLIGQSESPQAG